MKISSIEIHNFKTFQDAKATNIPDLAVFIGTLPKEIENRILEAINQSKT